MRTPQQRDPFAVLRNSNQTSNTRSSQEHRAQAVRITRNTLFKKLWSNYPVRSSALEAYRVAGGQALAYHLGDPIAYANACAIRFSRSLNYSGYTISKSASSPGGWAKGGDGLIYLIRVKDMIKLVTKKFGRPTSTFMSSHISMSEVQHQLMGKTGIIIFDVTGWGDATGHVTLWNGSTCGDSCYFNPNPPAKTDKVLFWEID